MLLLNLISRGCILLSHYVYCTMISGVPAACNLQEMKLSIGHLAKLDCFSTQKKINAFTLSQAKTSLRGGTLWYIVSSPISAYEHNV